MTTDHKKGVDGGGQGAPPDGRYTRREFLEKVGAGTAGVALGGSLGLAGLGTTVHPAMAAPASDRFGRIFKLPAFAEPTPALTDALVDIGKPGGLLDAQDNLAAGPILLITDPSLNVNNPNNPTHTAGTTFMGQFMDHDMTFDTTSRLGVPTAPEASPNARTPAFDLDSVYGGGPVASPQLYDTADRAKLRLESGGVFEDLPRGADMTAIIGDPRNDEHLIIAGLHAAFLLFHNHAVDNVRAAGGDSSRVFEDARRLTRWHYQWMILHEFLPLFVGPSLVSDILANGRSFYAPKKGEAFIPVEFQGAAYRFGHSMVRPSYRANLRGDINNQPFFGFIFDPSQEGRTDPDDLRGGARAPRRFIGWQTFFDFRDGEVKPNKKIDTKISTPLFHLPLGAIASHDLPTALPQRTLLRHITWLLPSGQSVAGQMQVPVLAAADLSDLSGYGLGLERRTPLWYYVLKEAELMEGGLHLGPVGGRIVAEVIIGLLQSDPDSYLSRAPYWTPELPQRDGSRGDFHMVDFLSFAGVDPASRGQ